MTQYYLNLTADSQHSFVLTYSQCMLEVNSFLQKHSCIFLSNLQIWTFFGIYGYSSSQVSLCDSFSWSEIITVPRVKTFEAHFSVHYQAYSSFFTGHMSLNAVKTMMILKSLLAVRPLSKPVHPRHLLEVINGNFKTHARLRF